MPTLAAPSWTRSIARHERLGLLKDRAHQAYEALNRRAAWTNSRRRRDTLTARVDIARRRWAKLGDALRKEERWAS